MKRVIAIKSIKNGHLRYYGEGTLVGAQVPDMEPHRTKNTTLPLILLDSGQYIWGHQCQWAGLELFNSLYEDIIEHLELIEFPEEEEIDPVPSVIYQHQHKHNRHEQQTAY